jgi:hypothetical protein
VKGCLVFFAVGILFFAIVAQIYRNTEPDKVEYQKIALDLPNKPRAFFKRVHSILIGCVGQDREACRPQVERMLRARDIPIDPDADFYLAVNTQYRERDAKAVVILFDKEDRELWFREVSISSPDSRKAARNLRAALVWAFASEWRAVNWKAGPNSPAKSAPLELEP